MPSTVPGVEVDTSNPETRLVLKLLRLQVLTPVALLVDIAAFLICGMVVKPGLKDLSRAFPTAVSPQWLMISMLWLVTFCLQILYCIMLVIGRKPETRNAMAYGVGLRLVLVHWLMLAYLITFSLKAWTPAAVILGVVLLFVAWINISLLWYPLAASRPLDTLAIHAPMRIFFLTILLVQLPQAIFIALDFIYSPDHPEMDYDKHAWEAFGTLIGVNFLGILWTALQRDIVWAIGGVWVNVAIMSERPKPVPVFAATIMAVVLYPLVLIVAVAWHRLRQKDREGVIALPPDDPVEREHLARERALEAAEHENGDGAARAWANHQAGN